MHRTDFSEFACSLAQAMTVLGDPWTPLILRDLYLGVDTFDGLVADLGISRSLLTRRLDGLHDEGIVRKQPYSDREDRFRYRLEPAGDELVPILAALTAWGDRWRTPPLGQPVRFVHEDHECVPMVHCNTCHEPIAAVDITPLPGPGAHAGRGTAIIASRPFTRG